MRKLKGDQRTEGSHLFLGLLLVLILAAMSCEMGTGYEPEQPTSPTNPTAPTNPNVPTSYHDFPNFNTADYPIINESGKSESEFADLKDFIWFMYAEREDVGEWTANYIKSNKIKTILSNENGAWGWINPSQLDRIYINEDWFHSTFFEEYYNNQYNDNDSRARMREIRFEIISHETMHIVQYKSSGWIDLMKGMRPDICAAARMMTEFLAWFYTTYRDDSAYVYADMPNAVETQSKYMVIETDMLKYQDSTKYYEDMRAKDPSLPPFIIGASWAFDQYAWAAMSTGEVWGSAMTPPLIKASKEDQLKIARALLACRDPKKAGVTDEVLWIAFDFLRGSVETGEHIIFYDYGSPLAEMRESFDQFQELIARWDAEYAAQQAGGQQVPAQQAAVAAYKTINKETARSVT